MAILHRAEIRPTKLELLSAWLPGRVWYEGPPSPEVTRVSAYRFDDPAGEVGIETLLVRAGDGPLLQVPLTYRAAPLDGRNPWLIGTMEHSVLGRRWVYDGCGDAVYAAVLAETIRTGGTQAEELVETDGRLERRDPGIVVRGSGSGAPAVPAVEDIVSVDDDPTIIRTAMVELTVARVLRPESIRGDGDGDGDGGDGLALTGTWAGQPTPMVLARARAIGG
jgi:hypothetical protein